LFAQRCDRGGVLLGAAPVGDDHGDARCALVLLRHEGLRRRGQRRDYRTHALRELEQVVPGEGQRSGGVGHRPEEQPKVGQWIDLVECVDELGHDPEVGAGPAQCPHQIGLALVGDGDGAAVGGDQRGGDQVVAGQAMLGRQPTYAAGEREPGHAGVADHPADGRKAVRGGRRVDFGPGGPGADVSAPRARIHPDVVHLG
jgi:hypothetical protein